jgi:hypothetical protein
MALASTVSGPGKLISKDRSERSFRSFSEAGNYRYTEVKTEETREWYALTEAAATAWQNGDVPYGPPAAGESRKIDRVSNVQGGEYRAISTITTTETVLKEFIPFEEI